ncbi:MAG: hypothetical protein ACWGON_10030, partial [Gemmatimonadota bacterium]
MGSAGHLMRSTGLFVVLLLPLLMGTDRVPFPSTPAADATRGGPEGWRIAAAHPFHLSTAQLVVEPDEVPMSVTIQPQHLIAQQGETAYFTGLGALEQGKAAASIDAGNQMIDFLPADAFYLRIQAFSLQAFGHQMSGNIEQGIQIMQEALHTPDWSV